MIVTKHHIDALKAATNAAADHDALDDAGLKRIDELIDELAALPVGGTLTLERS